MSTKRTIAAMVAWILLACMFFSMVTPMHSKYVVTSRNADARSSGYSNFMKGMFRQSPSVTINVNAVYGPNWTLENNQLPLLIDTRLYGHNLPIKQNQTWDASKEYWWYTSNMINMVKAIKPGILRFPGGGIADTAYFDRTNTYLWYQGPEGYNASIRADAIDMFVAFCRAVGAEPMIQVNFKSKNTQMAADIVRYANVEKGYNIKYWELGQRPELYPGNTVAKYQEDFAFFTTDMLAVDPTIRFIGPSTASPKVLWYDWALKNLSTSLSAISTQFYPLDANAPTSAPNYPAWASTLFNYDTPTGISEVNNFSLKMNNARTRWNASTEVAITELAAMTNGNKHNISDSLAYALYLADVLPRMASKGVDIVTQWKLIDENFNDTIIKHDSSDPMKHLYLPTPAYYTYLMLANFFGDVLVYANSSQDSVLSSYASLYSTNATNMSLLVVNKDVNNDIVAEININNWSISGDALVYTMTAPKPESAQNATINGYELDPENILESITYIPIEKVTSPSSVFWYTFPKHSMTIISFSGQATKSSENTPPTVPMLVSPPEGAALADKPQFSWQASTDAQGEKITYQLQVSTDRTFAGTVLDTTTTSTSYGMAYALPMGTYHWRVRAFDGNAFNSHSAWSEARQFTLGENTAPTVALVSPQNGGIAKGQMIRLQWHGIDAQTQTLKYALYLDHSDGTSLIADNIIEEHYDIALDNGAYKWKVSVTDGEFTYTSEVWSFTKSPNALPSAELVSPFNNSVILTPWVNLIWRGSDADADALKYDVYIDSGGGFTKAADLLDNVIYNFTIAQKGTYRWYVLPNDGFEYGKPSAIYAFDVEMSVNAPPAVSLVAPSNDAIVGNAQVTLLWNATDLDEELLTYDVYLDTSTTASTKLFSGLKENRATYTALSGTKYYWKVEASDGKITSSSGISSFSVDTSTGNKPPSFGAISPANGTITTTNSIAINWTATDPENDALTYKVFVGREGYLPVALDAGLGSSFTLAGLYRGKYIWFIAALDGKNAKCSDTRSFTVNISNAAPSAPRQLSPSDSAISFYGLVVLRCEQIRDPERAPVTYNFEVGPSPDLANAQVYVSQSNYIVLALPVGVHYWRVNATDGELYSPWSSVWKITVENGSIPTNLTYPINDIVVNKTQVVLRWEPVPGALYTIYLSQDKDLVKNEDNKARIVSDYADTSFAAGNLSNGTYYWTINATQQTQNQSAKYPIGKFIVRVGAEPVLKFDKATYSATKDENVKLTAKVENRTADFQYFFDFGDGSTSGWIKDATAEHKYNKTGKFNATVLARDPATGSIIGPANSTVDVSEKTAVGLTTTQVMQIIAAIIVIVVVIVAIAYVVARRRRTARAVDGGTRAMGKKKDR